MTLINLDKLRLLAGVQDESKDDLLSAFHEQAERLIASYIGEMVLPLELIWVAEEVAVVKYNRFGEEGLTSKGVDVVSYAFEGDLLKPFYPALDAYVASTRPKPSGFIRFF